MRRSVNLINSIEEHLHKARGNLMTQVGKDIDITQSINFFLGCGIRAYNQEINRNKKVSKDMLDFLEVLLEDTTIDSNERIFDLINTLTLQDKFRTTESKIQPSAQRREGAVKAG